MIETIMTMLTRLSATTRRPPTLLPREPATKQSLSRLTWVLSFLTGLFMLWALWRYGVAADSFARAPAWLGELAGLLTAAGFLTLIILWVVVGWQRIEAQRVGHVPTMTLDELYALSPRDFEHYVAALFMRRGYKVELRGRTGDLGVDLALTQFDGRKAIVQCKRYRHSVGPEIIRELFGTMVHERAAHGFLVTTAEISDGARAWAADKPITLIDGQTLVRLGKAGN